MNDQKITTKDVSAEEFKDLIESGRDDIIIIDCRTKSEFDESRLEGAILIDFYSPNFLEEVSGLPKDKKYLIYCRTGSRSKVASEMMERVGMKDIYNMEEGVIEWYQKGFNLVK